MKFTKTIKQLYLSPNTIINAIEGEDVPPALVEKYRNKLGNVGAIKIETADQPEAAQAPTKPSRTSKKEK